VFKFIALFIKFVFPLHYILLGNANHRKKIGTRFCLSYNMIQTQVTFKYLQGRCVLKYRKLKYNDTMQQKNRLLVKVKFVILL
jgi:hypothetical protein